MKSIKKKQNTTTIIIILLCLFSLFYFCTIAYSAFSSTMNITGMAHSRVEADVRITDFSLYKTSSSSVSYEEFGKNTISSQVSFNDVDSYIVYKIEVTNYGPEEVGIHSITGFPENTPYQIIDYNLKDKICNIDNKCTNYATKVFYIKFTGSNKSIEFTLNFDFRVYHTITYKNFTGTYPTEIMNEDSIEIDMSEENIKNVYISSSKDINYTYTNNKLYLKNISCDITIQPIEETLYTYEYIGNAQEFSVPYTGLYKVELWGAGGAINQYVHAETVGKGAYTSGYIYLNESEKLYVYVGGNDKFNGRGGGEAPGGGSTDIRLIGGNWNDFNSLKSRIMVAAGGGGGVHKVSYSGNSPGDAGGLIGYDAYFNPYSNGYSYCGHGATQTSGGAPGVSSSMYSVTTSMYGHFGWGGEHPNRASGGGGGYYGGGHGVHPGNTWPGAGGGSSFISGHNGCDAIDESSTESKIVHTGQSVHYSNYKFDNTRMIDGRGYEWQDAKIPEVSGMPTFDETTTMLGNTGTGYAKITFIGGSKQYEISYHGIKGSYQYYIGVGESLKIDFGSNAPAKIGVLINNKEFYNYKYESGILEIENVQGNIDIVAEGIVYEYSYTGNEQLFLAMHKGIYKIELWGAQGGYISHSGIKSVGLGGYVAGNIELDSNKRMYVYVGQNGYESATGTFNGTITTPGKGSSGGAFDGGGATDIRLINGSWNDFNSLKSRIMVAGAAGGSGWGGVGGEAGGLQGYTSTGYAAAAGANYMGKGATQISAGMGGQNTAARSGKFGIGGTMGSTAGGQGGGGYYGGGGGYGSQGTDHGAGGGGSSFISGHNGCDAIAENSTESSIIHTGQSIHYSNYSFTDTKMIDGKGYSWTTTKGSQTGMPNYAGTGTMTGNSGHGHAKITLIEVK